jgi:hypothetical protein
MLKIIKEPTIQALAVLVLVSIGGILWAHADGVARYQRCQASNPIEYCRLVFLGR